MELFFYLENPKICVVKTLSHYLEETPELRAQKSELLLTYLNPYHAVSTSTINLN